MFNIDALTKTQKGIIILVAGVVSLGLGSGFIPGLPAILNLAGLALILFGLYLLDVHTKIMALVNKK